MSQLSIIEEQEEKELLPQSSEKSFLEVMKDKQKGEIVEAGKFQGMRRSEARELVEIEEPTSVLLPEYNSDGRINVINRQINSVLRELPKDEVAEVSYSEFPSSIKHALKERLRSYGLVSFLIFAPSFLGIPLWGIALVWVVYSVMTALAALGFYFMFKNKDYVRMKGIVTSVREEGNPLFNTFRGRYKRTYVVTILTTKDDLVSFTYPYHLGHKELKDLSQNTPLTVFVRKGTKLVDSKYGAKLDDVIGFEVGEGNIQTHNELGEEYRVEDLV